MESISLKSGHQFIEVDIDEITHLEAMDNYVKIHRLEKPLVITQITMKEMERRLPAERFRRVHRSHIIALSQIERYAHRKIFCRQPDLRVPVGRKYLPDFLEYYRANFESRPVTQTPVASSSALDSVVCSRGAAEASAGKVH